MTTTADALEVMTIVAACHHRTAPRMDDRQAALATARIWAELFSIHHLELADLLAAVKKRALGQAEAPEPAEIIQFAREIRRDRAERETTAERQARENHRDAELDRRAMQALGQRLGPVIGKAVEDA